MSVTTDFCDECKSSVNLDDKKIDMHAVEDRHRPLKHIMPADRLYEAELHYQRRDDVPNLSRLRAGAEAGCRLCRSLRQEILKKHKLTSSWRAPPDNVTLTFSYVWRVDREQGELRIPSPHYLYVRINHPSFERYKQVIFDVYNRLRKNLYCFLKSIVHTHLNPLIFLLHRHRFDYSGAEHFPSTDKPPSTLER